MSFILHLGLLLIVLKLLHQYSGYSFWMWYLRKQPKKTDEEEEEHIVALVVSLRWLLNLTPTISISINTSIAKTIHPKYIIFETMLFRWFVLAALDPSPVSALELFRVSSDSDSWPVSGRETLCQILENRIFGLLQILDDNHLPLNVSVHET